MRAPGVAVLVALAALLGFVAGERRAAGDATHDATREAPASVAVATPHGAAAVPGLERIAAVPSQYPPLPPLNAPVAQVLGDLEREARAGDARAACRVAFELERCHGLRELQQGIVTFRELAEKPGIGPELARRYAAIADRDQARFTEGRRLCEGVKAAQADDAWRYLLQAARAGHVPSMARFASRRVFSDVDPVAALDGLIAFRDEGPSFLLRAAQAGYPEAYEQLGFAYVTGLDLGLGVPHDAVRGMAYYTALMRVATPEEAVRLQRAVDYAIQNDGLAADDVARARALAETLVAPLLRRNVPGTVETGRGAYSGDNGSHCER